MSLDQKYESGAEQFPHLPNAPIAEAVIHWRCSGTTAFSSEASRDLLDEFPAYDGRDQREIYLKARLTSKEVEATPEVAQVNRWDGFRFHARDPHQPYVVQFRPSEIVFSRLRPYTEWDSFKNEGMRWWKAFANLAGPEVIERLGVRFINKIPLESNRCSSDYLVGLPAPPEGIKVASESYLYQDRFRVVGQPFEVNWVRTTQPAVESERSLIIDIDVSTGPFDAEDGDLLETRLFEMRMLKDRLFFSCLTKEALSEFKSRPV